MTKITETIKWADEIYQIARLDKVEGGATGTANIQAKQLAARTQFLKTMLEGFTDYRESTFFKTAEDPDGTIAGRAATPAGKIFRVAQGPEADESFIFYLNADGIAVPVAFYAGKGYVDRRIVPGSFSGKMLPLAHGSNDVVPLWLDDGCLDAAGLGPQLQEFVAGIPNMWARQYLPQKNFNPKFFPACFGDNDVVPLWFDDGFPDAAGLGPQLQAFIKNLVGDGGGGTVSGEVTDKTFIQGDTYRLQYKFARLFVGEQVGIHYAWTGDSWTEKNTIPLSFLNQVGGKYKDPGWISCSTRGDGVMAGITLKTSGFTVYDGDNEHNNAPPRYGAGPDGNAMYNTGSVAYMTWSGVKATDLTLFYYDGTGSFSIIIDDITVATITGGNTGKALAQKISGLASVAHTVKIQTAGNGVVSILGMYGKDASNQSGVTVSRMGNGGAMASDYLNWKDWIAPVASALEIDLLFIVLGTNDFRKSAGTEQYRNGIQTIIDKHKEASPDICICLISPGQCSASGTPAISEYDKTMRELALKNNINFISGYELFPKRYDNSAGAWQDTLHLSSKGAYIITRMAKEKFYQE
ncbi:SGNH/GDSL hydrolase family protein [Klebsiella pneumoniae]|uniref:SGNH/GDSL hydrolase family protein n=1 Tax=Klebsiella pneumoniae TaxID=573 RepID=UPI001EE8DB1A|nr:GDSL-type esterase/lipase family protein [Klebsiella pneumoniae]HCI5728742.1 SGNH/GDSL hydrolase family protein [Klebsiella variicola subsp. variicola]MCJ5517642.1 GDSL-type esterase/lipase family protein [Klebsiella pneumoniae]MDP0974678.1 GDSL-type esterase/lipase family protein [Klebsiella pneumoniae]MDP0986582.1 GDSL-type esterase/lipase family protein [Klebsiella pneumoniae]MDP0996716.1 GDSL-type esterase/lipase family protein [Klebsiella pneumoniae]